MSGFKTEQEKFWAGSFGDDYIARNNNEKIIAGNARLFAEVFTHTREVRSVIEFGSNIGLNLLGIRRVLPHAELSAIEINKSAADTLRKTDGVKVYNESLLEFEPDYPRDFVFIKQVLIHINPEMLPAAYDRLHKTSKKYILVAEYYNPTPVTIEYRGHKDRLFKRDFAGEMLDRFKDLRLAAYGFTYHRDNYNEYDDVNWFLLEK